MARAQDTHHSATPMPGMQMSQEFDLIFIDMMIPHHEGAIAMAEVALTEGEHQEIRDLAKAIVESQQGEIDQLQAWRDAWYPDAPEMPMDQMTQYMDGMMQMPAMMGTPSTGMMGMPSMQGHMGDPAADAEALRNATGPFDQAFIEEMIPHHQSAVAMAEIALRNAVHPEIATLAQEIIDAQQREITEMQSWLAAWYGGTPVAAASGVQRVEVMLTEFGIQSSVTAFESNTPYLFSVTNAGKIPHELMIMPRMDGMGQMDMATLHDMALLVIPVEDLPPGASKTVEMMFPEGSSIDALELVCAEAGHYDAGMALNITVK
jgi:uncharacterized protein (DUF305 family)